MADGEHAGLRVAEEAETAPSVASARTDDRRSGLGRVVTTHSPTGTEDGQDQEGGGRRGRRGRGRGVGGARGGHPRRRLPRRGAWLGSRRWSLLLWSNAWRQCIGSSTARILACRFLLWLWSVSSLVLVMESGALAPVVEYIDKVVDVPVVEVSLEKTLDCPRKRFIGKIVDILVMAKRPKSTRFQSFSKRSRLRKGSTLTRWSMFQSCRSCRIKTGYFPQKQFIGKVADIRGKNTADNDRGFARAVLLTRWSMFQDLIARHMKMQARK